MVTHRRTKGRRERRREDGWRNLTGQQTRRINTCPPAVRPSCSSPPPLFLPFEEATLLQIINRSMISHSADLDSARAANPRSRLRSDRFAAEPYRVSAIVAAAIGNNKHSIIPAVRFITRLSREALIERGFRSVYDVHYTILLILLKYQFPLSKI